MEVCYLDREERTTEDSHSQINKTNEGIKTP